MFVMPGAEEKMKFFTGPYTIFDLRTGYSVIDVITYFDFIGEEGLYTYRSILLWEDLFFPLTNGLLYSLAIIYFFKRSFINIPQLGLLGIFPFISMIFDYLENFSIVNLIDTYPDINATTVALASSFTLLKWGFMILGLMILFSALLIFLFKKYIFKRIN
jgi:hypothetical protein